MHGPYFINLCGQPDVIEKSKVRLIDSLRAASWIGAHHVVYHPGYYMDLGKLEALKLCIKSAKEIVEEAAGLGIRNVSLSPETTGKPTQLGSLEEIIEMCEKVDKMIPTVDWAHLHARDGGRIKKKEDYLKLTDIIEKRLGREAIENLHCHFTHIEFTEKGERRHHTLDEEKYGPPFQPLAEIIAEQGLKPVIISESPLLDIDSVKMQNMVLKEVLKKS
jgi:deoxyribonuclease-4